MNQEPQAPLRPEKEIPTIGKRVSGDVSAADTARTVGFGEKLRRERELRSISLDEIANTTKIGTRMLHALEDEEFSKLPGGIFNKGFVRAYARYLGISEEQAVLDYLAAETEQERKLRTPAQPEPNKQGQPQMFAIQGGSRPDNVYNIRATAEAVQQSQPDQARGFMWAAVILVFVLGIGGFGWKYFTSHSSYQPVVVKVAAGPVKSELAPALPSTTAINPPAATTAAKTAPATSPLQQSLPAQTRTGDPVSEPKTSTPAASKTSPELSSDASLAGEFTLDLRADEDSWAQITADGKQLWSGVVSKDGAKSFRATKELTVKLGNAPGVQLSYNGKALPRFSQDPETGAKTRTLIFTSDGLSQR